MKITFRGMVYSEFHNAINTLPSYLLKFQIFGGRGGGGRAVWYELWDTHIFQYLTRILVYSCVIGHYLGQIFCYDIQCVGIDQIFIKNQKSYNYGVKFEIHDPTSNLTSKFENYNNLDKNVLF